MKAFSAILLLAMLLFNCIGYRFLCMNMEIRAVKSLDAQLDDHRYYSGDLVGFKIPLHRLSYYNSSSRFERHSGRVTIGGVQYQYVESRIYGDSIEVRCIPNRAATAWAEGRNDFFSRVNGLIQPDERQSGHRQPPAVQDRNDEYFSPQPASITFLPAAPPKQRPACYPDLVCEIFKASPDHPPQV